MKKTVFIVTVLFLMGGVLFAQFQAPENLLIRDTFSEESCVCITLLWDEITDPNLDHFELYWDDNYVSDNPSEISYFYFNNGVANVDFTLEMYHAAGIKAIYTTGESEMSTVNFFLSEPMYATPQNLEISYFFDECAALLQWDEPEVSGATSPTPTEYDLYLDGEYISTTPELEFTFENLVYGQSYYLEIAVHYSDGHYSLTFRPLKRKEIFFQELEPPADVNIDNINGILSWTNPGQGDVIGGAIMNLVAAMGWPSYWPSFVPASLGDEVNNVNLIWGIGAWSHTEVNYAEGINLEGCAICEPTLYGSSDITNITELNEPTAINFSMDDINLYDGDTSVDGYGDFGILYNTTTNNYGAFQLIDATHMIDPFAGMCALNFHASWWFDTTGNGDFSSADRYFPLYYNIYLDGELINSVCYELIVNNNGEPLIIDPTLYPTNQFEYQFEDLVQGQEYNVGIEAVYHVGKADIEYFDFVYGNVAAENPTINVTNLQGNYPNPFNPTTTISFSTTEITEITELVVYNVKGQKVKTLVNEKLSSGQHSVVWNGKDNDGKTVSSGVYFYKMKSGDFERTNKMILMK